jgi:hypothetical protein
MILGLFVECDQESILRLLNLQTQRQRCIRLERFFQSRIKLLRFQDALPSILVAL